MTSQINPATIDGNYPIAGVPNNTQGMRDNFTAIKTNFQYAETEIDELQSKGVFKAALTGTTLDNNMANNLIYNAKIQGFSGTLVQIANTTGAITVDCSAAHYQTITMGGNISVSFTTATWPAAGSVGIIRLQITVDTPGRTLTLPANVSLGTTGIQGYSANVITFAAAGVYEFGFLTYDQGTTITLFDYNRPLSYYTNSVTIANTAASTSNVTGALTVAGGVGIGGNLYVTGDIFGNVTLTDISVGTVTATGNIVGGNINTAANVSATGNIAGGNILGGANVNATTHTGTTVSVTGNVNGGNIISAALAQAVTLSATGAVTFSGTTTNQSIGTSQSTGTLTMGGTSGTGIITVGRSTASQTTNIQSGATGTGNTKTINIGDGGLAGSTTTIAVGPVSATTAAGTVTFNTATVVAVANTSGTALSVAGNVTGGNIRTAGQVIAASGTAIAAGGTQSLGLEFSSTADFGIFFGSGTPTISAAKGSLYLRSDGSTTNDRMYVNTNGSTTWTPVITLA
jgi:hypothetical protein